MQLADVFSFIKQKKGTCYLKAWMSKCIGKRSYNPAGKIDIRDFDGHPVAKALCLNVIREVKFENIPPDRLKEILFDLDNHIEAKTTPLSNALTQVQGFSSGHKHDLCQGQEPITEDIVDLSRVMTYDQIMTHGLKDGQSIPLNELVNTSQTIAILAQLLNNRRGKGHTLGKFRTSLPLYWCSKNSEISGKFDKLPIGTDKANKVRDALGLFNMKYGYAVEVLFPLVEAPKLRTPTFFDAGPSPYFCTTKEPDKWGRTRDLRTLQKALSEAVHEESDWPSQFRLEPLGEISPPNEPSLSDWEQLGQELWVELLKLSPSVENEIVDCL